MFFFCSQKVKPASRQPDWARIEESEGTNSLTVVFPPGVEGVIAPFTSARGWAPRMCAVPGRRSTGQPRGLALRCANRIPHGRGLGSSSAAIVAGVLAARALVVGANERLDDEAALRLAASIEGHPDNVAACLLGGYTIAWSDSEGVRALTLPVAASIVPVVFVPSSQVATSKARRLLPEQLPFADAARSAGRAALLTAALGGRPDLLLAATEDRLHQRYRAGAMPRSASLVEQLRLGGVAAVISGAGPTVLALTDATGADTVQAQVPRGWTVLRLDVEPAGARIVPL